MHLKSTIFKYLFLPIADMLQGERVFQHLKFLEEAENWSEKQIEDFRNLRLRKLIDYAAENVPFYIDFFKSSSISPKDINTIKDLVKLPVVDKELMRKEGVERFNSISFPKRKIKHLSSSGSTGKPFHYIISKEALSVNEAAKIHTWYKAGYRFGNKYMKIANSPRHSAIKKIQDWINNCIYVSFESFDEKCINSILTQIETEKPLFIRSYPAPLFILARYRNSHPEYSFSPKRIFTTGSTLSSAYRNVIESAFGCDIIDSYSCEGTPNVYETSLHNGYIVNQEYGIIEDVDGQIVSTDFWNLAHPFIRYNTHDLATGFSTFYGRQKIERITGRQSDAFVISGGKTFTVHDFSSFFIDENDCIEAYQIVKKGNDEITFRLVANDNFTYNKADFICNYWKNKLAMPVSIEIVDEIPMMKNNKWLTIVED